MSCLELFLSDNKKVTIVPSMEDLKNLHVSILMDERPKILIVSPVCAIKELSY